MFREPLEIYFSFDEDSIFVQAGNLGKKFANLIAIDKEINKIVGVGETEAEISAYNPEIWDREKHKVLFEPIYDSKNFNPENMYWALTMWARGFEYELRGFKLTSNAICHAKILGYESFSKEAREYFEYMVQSIMKFRKFIINGSETILDRRKLFLANGSLEWGRWISLAVLLFLIGGNIDALTSKLDKLSSELWFVFPVLLIISLILVIWTVDILWLMSIQHVLPKKFVRWIFNKHNNAGWSVSKFLARLVLGDD